MTTTTSVIISKSKYLSGLQCSKRLWIEYNDRGMIPDADAGSQAIFDQGKEVGNLAKKLFPDGIEVTGGYREFEELHLTTQRLLPLGISLFEPAFLYGSALVRVDILVPAGDGSWDLIEVKSSGGVKETYLDDISFQYYVCSGAGVSIRRCCVMHIDKEYVLDGELEPRGLFTCVDVTTAVRKMAERVPDELQSMQSIIDSDSRPQQEVGPHCGKPYQCPLIPHCWSFLPEDNVFTLYRMRGKKSFELLGEGYASVLDLPPDYPLTERQAVQRRGLQAGETQVDRDRIKAYLGSLMYPLSFLDFETINPAVPRYQGTRPFQQIPFQFSLHIVRTPGAAPEHHSFLAEGAEDPRPELLRRLEMLLDREGSIVVYNAPFEKGCLEQCARMFPDYSRWCDRIVGRLSDLCLLFSDFSWYHPAQHGSASMKAVLPLLTGLSYDELEISDGTSASNAFMKMAFGEMGEEERRTTREDLERYCGLDTRGMVAMVEAIGRTGDDR